MNDIKSYKYRDYNHYIAEQINGNLRKSDWVWVIEKDIKFLCKYIQSIIKKPIFGICHGVRTGQEQAWFMQYLPSCKVIGTEISPSRNLPPNTLKWDFHEVKSEWLKTCDFIYTNSWDHAYDFKKALDSWLSCLTDKGILILEHSIKHGPDYISKTDPFGATVEGLKRLVKEYSSGYFRVTKILNSPDNNEENVKFLIIKRKVNG